MNFASLLFLPFFGLTSWVYPRLKSKKRMLLLLGISWTFLLLESAPSGAILFFLTLLTWGLALCMDRFATRPRVKKSLFGVVLLVSLGLLALFKYSGLFFLPPGISFYTFQALSYSLDVYRGEFPVQRSLPHYALYLSFFPQVVAGPIERPKDLMDQLLCKPPVTGEDLRQGGYLLLRGYVKKLVMADTLAPLVDRLFEAGKTIAALEF